jgi:nicotinate-nucleotide adenylyltransferase
MGAVIDFQRHHPILWNWEGLPGRIGILGGTFDPVHLGHVHAAREAQRRLGLNLVVFLPAGANPDKRQAPGASRSERLEMLVEALADEPDLYVSPWELLTSGPSYTFRTLTEIRTLVSPEARLFFIIGADCLHGLHRWDRLDRITDAAALTVAARRGSRRSAVSACRGLAVGTRQMLSDHYLEMRESPWSSLSVRNNIGDEKFLDAALAARVARLVRGRNLYGYRRAA